ncbi:hypothetical protein BV22DRAFT_980558, partial [Leucogyrophana mollusca]
TSPRTRTPPPLYASFTPAGTLDVPGTLLVLARRFEKLERWSVGHTRALEERMGDVERWLVEREAAGTGKDQGKGEEERGKDQGKGKEEQGEGEGKEAQALTALRADLAELHSRMSEMGREMALLAANAANHIPSNPATYAP